MSKKNKKRMKKRYDEPDICPSQSLATRRSGFVLLHDKQDKQSAPPRTYPRLDHGGSCSSRPETEENSESPLLGQA